MELAAGSLRFLFTCLFPEKVLFNVPGEESEKNAGHEGIVDHADAGQRLGNQVEGVEQIDQAEKATHEGASRPLAVTAGEKVAEHGRAGADETGEVGELGAGAKGVHDGSFKTKMKMKMKSRRKSRWN